MLEQESFMPPQTFTDDLKTLAQSGIYSEESLELAREKSEYFSPLNEEWNKSLISMAETLGSSEKDPCKLPALLEQLSLDKIRKKFKNQNLPFEIIVGLAGPGAVGKNTIADELGFSKVKNTTTRPKRSYETNDLEYHFVDESLFDALKKKGSFAVSSEKPGRGLYGIQEKDVEQTLASNDIALVEENPENLTKLQNILAQKHPEQGFILVYILPPAPVLPHLATRLAKRCLDSKENYSSVVRSTLGKRQLDEFNSLEKSQGLGINVVFLINDTPKRVKTLINDLMGKK